MVRSRLFLQAKLSPAFLSTEIMNRPRTVHSVAALVASSALDIPFAAAQAHDRAAGEALFQEGRRLMKTHDFAPACSKFEESLRLDPATGTLLNLADCEEQLGHTATCMAALARRRRSTPNGRQAANDGGRASDIAGERFVPAIDHPRPIGSD